MEEELVALSIAEGEGRRMHANLQHPLGGFYYEIDLARFLEGSPWMFNNHLLLFHRLKVGEDSLAVPLFWSDF
ncbi:hypothetical protein ES288_D04G133300v1 [Gossypium darwinii]|uniref:DUF4283 domain-containing protein n=2 Tax=Gossypium TaxID=3633 RepID=A0A5D2LDU4_GOSTO|nr:hypothetical protein ES288_D04G133300v1 [Gossypium darwinii]TYH77186.1 hypothetical protein ES332_D04G135600v1 [Gossypium tomentosum]